MTRPRPPWAKPSVKPVGRLASRRFFWKSSSIVSVAMPWPRAPVIRLTAPAAPPTHRTAALILVLTDHCLINEHRHYSVLYRISDYLFFYTEYLIQCFQQQNEWPKINYCWELQFQENDTAFREWKHQYLIVYNKNLILHACNNVAVLVNKTFCWNDLSGFNWDRKL